MKRFSLLALMVCVLAAPLWLAGGCTSSAERSVRTTRQHQAHLFRNRIHNPADYRCASR